MPLVFLVAMSCAGQLTDDQQRLLKIFHSEFVAITPGEGPFPKSFTMGRRNEAGPLHEVTLHYTFRIAKYEVPQNLWTAVMGTNPSRWKGSRNSVEMLGFDEAQQFCMRATGLMKTAQLIAANEQIRLPTEAEWEYCCRAGTTSAYSFGDDVAALGEYAWSTHNAAGNDPEVGVKKPNPWGLYDIHGYLWEWCLDAWHPDYSGAPTDGSAWLRGGDDSLRVLRGGSWKDAAPKLTSSFRNSAPRLTRDDAIGLRCVLARR
jgi:formylglycine-generating enzyme required for sulfatase activity